MWSKLTIPKKPLQEHLAYRNAIKNKHWAVNSTCQINYNFLQIISWSKKSM